MTMHHQLEVYVKENRKRFEDLLGQMVNIPSISMDPVKANDMCTARQITESVRSTPFTWLVAASGALNKPWSLSAAYGSQGSRANNPAGQTS